MKNLAVKAVLFISCCILLFSCKEPKQPVAKDITRGFYYWRSVLKLTDYEKAAIDSLHISTLYVKFFDVDWNEVGHQPNPVAQLRVTNNDALRKLNIIPVIFITNESLLKIDSAQVIPLAEKIHHLVSEIVRINKLDKITEIQIDCDWTVATRQKYFKLLEDIRQLSKPWALSATIRLHQVKFYDKAGIPPVDKGLLMCYNMGNLKNPATTNSIIHPDELKKYVGNLSHYSLQLDVALPLFEWYVLFRNGRYSGLIQNISKNDLDNSAVEKDNNRYHLLKDTILAGYHFKKEDLLRYEKSDYDAIIEVAKTVNEKLQQNRLTVSLYHLDSITLSKYTVHEMENIYNSFH